jgi:hypothetical protein
MKSEKRAREKIAAWEAIEDKIEKCKGGYLVTLPTMDREFVEMPFPGMMERLTHRHAAGIPAGEIYMEAAAAWDKARP